MSSEELLKEIENQKNCIDNIEDEIEQKKTKNRWTRKYFRTIKTTT